VDKDKYLFWIYGNYYQSHKAWGDICSKTKDARIEILDCGHNPDNSTEDNRVVMAGGVIKALKNKDIFDKRPRIIKLKGLPSDYTIITDYLHLVNKKCVLVIDASFGHYKSKRFNSAKTSNFYKTVKAEGKILEFPLEATRHDSAVKWVKDIALNFEKKIDDDAAQLVVEMKGRNLDALYAAVVLLRDYQIGKNIKKSDVETACVSTFLRTVWDLIESIFAQDYNNALLHMQRFYQLSEVPSEFPSMTYEMLGALMYKFRPLVLIKDSINDKDPTFDNVKAALFGYKRIDKKNSDGEDEDQSTEYKEMYDDRFIGMSLQDSGFNRMLRLSRDQIYSKYSEILEVQKYVRIEARSNTQIKEALDSLIMVLCGTITPSVSKQVRKYKVDLEA
jgi:hypothetical protein